MSAESNKQVVRKFFEDFSANRMQAVFDAMTDDATWWVGGSFPLSGKYTKQQFQGLLANVVETLPGGIQIATGSMVAEGDKVAVEATSRAENVKNGKSYRNQYHFAIDLKNGKIHAVREYLDTQHANDVLCS
jgi:ketosteroid isomerase-like protein